jgi:hypothetical protein
MRFNLIGYNSSPRYRPHADTARKFHDYSCTILIVIFNGLGFFVAHSAFPDIFKWESYPILVYLVLGGISLYLVMRSTVRPHRFRSPPAQAPMPSHSAAR